MAFVSLQEFANACILSPINEGVTTQNVQLTLEVISSLKSDSIIAFRTDARPRKDS